MARKNSDARPQGSPEGKENYLAALKKAVEGSIEDSGGSSFICICPGTDDNVHRPYCSNFWFDPIYNMYLAGQALFEAGAGEVKSNSWAEAASMWEEMYYESDIEEEK